MKILYLHNKPGWALHNVGLKWSSLPAFKDTTFTFADYHTIPDLRSVSGNYDYIWFSLYIYEKYTPIPGKCIVTLHDPLELYSQDPCWREKKIPLDKLRILKQIKYLTVATKELQILLMQYGINGIQTSTAPQVPVRRSLPTPKTLRYLSVANFYPRKNITLLQDLSVRLANIGIQGTLKLGDKKLPLPDYISLLDSHQIYLCTSFQEGGPLPAMEAMARGQVVLTTPVGQLPELIQDGINGFICTNMDDFCRKASLLKEDPCILKKMSYEARHSIAHNRSRNMLNMQMGVLLSLLCKSI